MDKKSIQQYTDNITQNNHNGYFIPIIKTSYHNGIEINHYITKEFFISILFGDLSSKKQQKILRKAKQLNIWSVHNDIFEPITLTISRCKKECKHCCSNDCYDFGDCYHNNIEYKRELLKLNLHNIPDSMKIKNTENNNNDKTVLQSDAIFNGNFYWINIKVLKSLIDLFVILISKPHSTIGFTDRTPVYLLPPQYYPLKWKI